MAFDTVTPYGYVSRSLASATAYTSATQAPVRQAKYGEVCTSPVAEAYNALAAEGSYFCAVNPTPGTGIAGIAAADGYDATETLLLLYNRSTVAEGIYLTPDFIEIHCTVVDTAGTDIRYDVHIDQGTDRYTSGGSAITPANVNTDFSATPTGRLHFGALVTTAASSNVRRISGRLLSSTDLVANDVIRLNFGSAGKSMSQAPNYSEEATLGRIFQISLPPVVLGPLGSLLFTVNCSSQSGAATWTFNTGWYER